MFFCCSEPPYNEFDLGLEVEDWSLELNFERLQRMNVKIRRFAGRHNLEMIVFQPHGLDSLNQAVQNTWAECKSISALRVSTPVRFLKMKNKAQSVGSLEHDLFHKFADVLYRVMCLGAFLRCARYGLADRLNHPWMVIEF